ncbi:zinc finger protein 723-like [Eurosta solidaginis]|uniref:zinc finger protein 723-like n=1 Tax=Eurosta solidaginis TaxID=178769 RepID=UPI0035310654
MNTKTDQTLDFLCRTCMQELIETSSDAVNTKPEQLWQSIFDTIEECGSLHITELLSSSVPNIEVKINDELPQKICHKCLKQLQCIYRFQEMCLQTQQHLQQFVVGKANANLEIVTEAAIEHVMTAKDLAEQSIEFNYMDTLPVAMQSSDLVDPLQSKNEVKLENCNGLETDSVYLRNELCGAGKQNEEYSCGGTLLSMVAIKNEFMDIDKQERLPLLQQQQQRLPSSENTCAVCNKSFKYPGLLQNHLKIHQKDVYEYSRYECNLCNRFFYKPETLQKHRIEHDSKAGVPTRTYTCDLCNKSHKNNTALWRHKKTQHSDKNEIEKKYACEWCDKAFTLYTVLKDHERIHTGERPYLCPVCGKSFRMPGQLKQHSFRHEGVKRYECPHCPMKFRCSSDLSHHKVIKHGEIKRHVCDICAARFPTLYELKKHNRYHTGERPFKCDYCDKRFVEGGACRRHMLTHTGEKPYKCKYCERAFTQSGDHIKHLRVHIGENVYRCELCPSAFRLLSEKRSHFATHKNDDEETRERNKKALKEEEAKLHLQASSIKNTQVAEDTVIAET